MLLGSSARAGDVDPLPELFSVRRWRELAEALGLTSRQAEVAKLICRGLGDEEIAESLGVSVSVVHVHTVGLYKRLAVKKRVGVVVRLVLAERRIQEKDDSDGPT